MFKRLNILLLFLPIMLYSLGFITLLSTSPQLIKSHLLFFLISIVCYFLFTYLDYDLLNYFWRYIYILSVILLLLTWAIAEVRMGSARWLQLGSMNFQTSEFAKLALILSLASYIQLIGPLAINQLKNIFILTMYFLPLVLFVFIQPDLGTAIVLSLIFIIILFYSGLNKIYLLYTFLVTGIFSSPLWHFLKDYQKNRILVFLNPQMDVLGSGYNVIQSIIAIGSGGLFGKGFGRGTQANLQFLPAYWTDFIFASFAEEWGFLGVTLMIILYCLLLLVILYVSIKVKDMFGKIICIGVFVMILSQFVVNVGMNLGLMPVTGVTLPLVSYGGSSLLFTMISLGIVHSIWRKNTA